jgi:mannose-6-phosphate isomerase-like protein (cupin superfamily)
MIEQIQFGDQILGIIVRNGFNEPGIQFFTPESFSQQLAYMNRPAGYKIVPHFHNSVKREVFYTQEILFIKKGKLKIDFYDRDRNYVDTRILENGDTILLASGGHGFEMLEQTEIIEVKQGPYTGEQDKIRFETGQ